MRTEQSDRPSLELDGDAGSDIVDREAGRCTKAGSAASRPPTSPRTTRATRIRKDSGEPPPYKPSWSARSSGLPSLS
jgi:hypothetical protein